MKATSGLRIYFTTDIHGSDLCFRKFLNAAKFYQPLLALHGHVHESAGNVKIGRTLCINPGSEYGEGVLRGASQYFVDFGFLHTVEQASCIPTHFIKPVVISCEKWKVLGNVSCEGSGRTT